MPYRPRPIDVRSGWTTWLVEDQRFVDHRPDVLTWVTDPLKDEVVVSGKVIANLFASTTGTDSDWIVKLIDVYPEKNQPDPKMSGFQLMIAGDVLRGRYATASRSRSRSFRTRLTVTRSDSPPTTTSSSKVTG